MAGLGIPSVAVCTDTRLLMVDELGLPIHYVKEVDADTLEEETEFLIKNSSSVQHRLLTLQLATWNKYKVVIEETLSRS
jgi:hypothetical protein